MSVFAVVRSSSACPSVYLSIRVSFVICYTMKTLYTGTVYNSTILYNVGCIPQMYQFSLNFSSLQQKFSLRPNYSATHIVVEKRALDEILMTVHVDSQLSDRCSLSYRSNYNSGGSLFCGIFSDRSTYMRLVIKTPSVTHWAYGFLIRPHSVTHWAYGFPFSNSLGIWLSHNEKAICPMSY